MAKLKVFTAEHSGIWLGGCSVVVAKDEAAARALLSDALDEHGIILSPSDELTELDLTKASAHVLWNGDTSNR